MNTTEILITLNVAAFGIAAVLVASAVILIRQQIRRGQEASQALKEFLAAEREAARPMEH